MDYVITNSTNKVYIRLDHNGSPVTCTRKNAQIFECSKARNIVDHLPKRMKRYHFRAEAVPEIVHTPKEEKVKEVIVSTCYTTPDSVKKWVDRVKDYNELAKDASKRKEELVNMLSNVDKELSNCLHKIELTTWKNGCDGYKEYKAVKMVLEKRRIIKDELSIVQSILESNLESISLNRIEDVVNRLSARVFSIREVKAYDDL